MVQKSINNQATLEDSPSDVDFELSAPRPLSPEQFDRIVVLNQIKEMEPEELKSAFHCDEPKENTES